MVSRWPKSPFWYRDLFLGIEILQCVVQHLDRLLPGINLCVLFWASTSYKLEVREDLDTQKKIEKSRYLKKTSRYQLKESPDFREGEEDSNFSVFRVRRFSEWPEPLH